MCHRWMLPERFLEIEVCKRECAKHVRGASLFEFTIKSASKGGSEFLFSCHSCHLFDCDTPLY